MCGGLKIIYQWQRRNFHTSLCLQPQNRCWQRLIVSLGRGRHLNAPSVGWDVKLCPLIGTDTATLSNLNSIDIWIFYRSIQSSVVFRAVKGFTDTAGRHSFQEAKEALRCLFHVCRAASGPMSFGETRTIVIDRQYPPLCAGLAWTTEPSGRYSGWEISRHFGAPPKVGPLFRKKSTSVSWSAGRCKLALCSVTIGCRHIKYTHYNSCKKTFEAVCIREQKNRTFR